MESVEIDSRQLKLQLKCAKSDLSQYCTLLWWMALRLMALSM